MRAPAINTTTNNEETGGFAPFGRTPTGGRQTGSGGTSATTTTSDGIGQMKLPALRLLSNNPVGGYGASTTASTTVVRWIDRGRGNVYEARYDSSEIKTLSNTILPKMYESIWNKNLTAFIGSILENDETSVTLYAELKPRPTPKQQGTTTATSTIATNNSSLSPFDLKGKNLPENIITYAISPKKDKLFILVNENGSGVGYVSGFDGKSLVKIFSTPLTKLNAEWPEENTLAITTKSTYNQSGFLYFINPKTGKWKKILGPIRGLGTKVSRDAKHVVYSAFDVTKNSIISFIYSVDKNTVGDSLVRTLADKCIWGKFYKQLVYCAAPSQIPQGNYPDDWYKGLVSFTDKVWQIDAVTGEVRAISTIVDQSDRLIDIYNVELSDKDEYIFFMNKNDLSLWSLDLILSK